MRQSCNHIIRFANHEKSRIHRENAAILKQVLEEEEKEQQLWNSFTTKDTIVSDDGSSDSPTEDSKTF